MEIRFAFVKRKGDTLDAFSRASKGGMTMDELSRNGSGYYDPTASPVLHAIHKREMEVDENANRIIRLIKDLLRICDFELIERIQIRHKPTGREYR